jgi:hypothetical protein
MTIYPRTTLACALTLGFGLACSGSVDVGDVEELKVVSTPSVPMKSTLKGAGTKTDPYVLTCSTRAMEVGDFTGEVSAWVSCPAGCTSGSLYGTCMYTFDSMVCVAANHSGALPASPYPGGPVKVKSAPGISGGDGYVSSKQGDINSSAWSSYAGSMTFAKMTADACKKGK